MDIIIKIPKKEEETILKEYQEAKKDNLDLSFKVSNLPLKVEEGDKCYFSINGFLRGYHLIKRLDKNIKFKCEVTKKPWAGNFIVRSGPTLYECEPMKLPFTIGRSYTYVETELVPLANGLSVTAFRRPDNGKKKKS